MNYEFLQVLADQAIWAVCGRAAAVVDMSSVPKQTVAVEVMPLVGGHLRLPKVRVSKYVEGAAAAVAGRASVNSVNAGTYSNKAVIRLRKVDPDAMVRTSGILRVFIGKRLSCCNRLKSEIVDLDKYKVRLIVSSLS